MKEDKILEAYEKMLEGKVDEGKEGIYSVSFGVNFGIYSNDMDKAEKIAEKYMKTIKTKGKDKVLNIEFEASDEPE